MTTRRETLGLMATGALLSAATPLGASTQAPVQRHSPFSELFETHDALGLAELVRRGEVSPLELLEAAIGRCEAVDARLNAVTLRHDAWAREQAAAVDRTAPFAGVPFLLKDLGVGLAGTVTTAGSRFFADARAAVDSEIVRRYRQAGLVIFGKTASPELGLTGTTESVLHGATRNPWNPERTTGGSSGGAAAVVAARVIPIAHASDGGGSIRTPASCCGVFGLKPSRGRMPLGPLRFEGWNGLTIQHAVSMTVRDNAALLDATAGAEPGSPYVAPTPVRSFLEETRIAPGRLRIGLVSTPPSGAPVDPEVLAALDEVAEWLARLGHEVESTRFPIDHAATNQGMIDTLMVSTRKALEDRAREVGRAVTAADVELVTWAFHQGAATVGGIAYARAREAFDRAGYDMAKLHERFDVILTPTLAKPPVEIGTLSLSPKTLEVFVSNITAFGPFTALYNMTGQPAMSVPLARTREGLPIGMMFAAAYGQEGLLYRLASQLEAARPWRSQRAPHAVSMAR